MKSPVNMARASKAGFSLIEVLIAVVVLSVGLLALANLQMSLIRSSSETRTQSVALSIAKDSIEQSRAFNALAGYDALADIAQADADTMTVGGVDFEVWQEVERYAYNRTDGEFQLQGDTATLGADFENSNEFKVVRVFVGWTDSAGESQEIVLEDAIGAVPPENSARVARKRLDASNRKPRVIIVDPSTEDGVIPIAIGDGSETAATNPRPTIVGNQGTAIKETNYDIFTYSALNDGTAQAQARVETSIVGCRCDFADADQTATAFRPAFWNGTRYEVPEEAPYQVPAGQDMAGNKPAVDQSALCEACCRDHHDAVSGTTGAKFSPRRAEHTHFLGLTESDGIYDEACRLIRVDGFMRVAPDPYNEHLNLLETALEFTSPAPDPAAAELYEDFVISFLDAQFTNRSSGYNTSLTDDEANGLAEPLVVDELVLQQFQPEETWLHARGLYVDFLETDAVAAINNAKSNCDDDLTTSECVLRVLPFTSINLSEVAGWAPATQDVFDGEGEVVNDYDIVDVTMADFVDAIESGDPVRGQLQAKAAGVTNASALMRTSTSGLTGDENFLINPDEQSPERADQLVNVEGAGVGGVVSTTLGRNESASSTSAEPLAAFTAGPTATLTLTVNFAQAVDDVVITLQGPDGVTYTVATEADYGAGTYTFSFEVPADGAEGSWIFIVERTSNPSQPVELAWGLRYVASVYTVQLSGYTFSSTSTARPAISASPSATCNPAAGGNPYTCASSSGETETTLTLGNYNYEFAGSSTETVNCMRTTGPNAGTARSCDFVPQKCTNYSVLSATNGGDAGTVGSATSPGGLSDTTPITFSAVGNGDAIDVLFSAGASTNAVCTIGNNCNSPEWTCAQ